MMEFIAAPAGWGFRTGQNMLGEPVEFPEIEGIEKMSSTKIMRTFITMLMDRPELMEIATGSIMKKKYPSAPRHACYMCIVYANEGKMPQKMGRPVKNGFSKLT